MERRPRRHYTREFKLEAVRLAAVDGRAKAQIALQLGIRVGQLRKWDNRQRRHSTVNYEAPLVFEAAQAAS